MTSREFKDRVTRRARRVDLSIPATVAVGLERYYRLLALWNAKMNLTALPLESPEDETFDRLLIEPLLAARLLPEDARIVVDVGSGSGSPALPMALATPGLHLRMVESKTRKAVFLTEAVRHLELRHAVVETARFEQLLARPELHEAADIVTLRAVRVELRSLMTLQAFLKPGGQLFWFRSAGHAQPEVPPPFRSVKMHPLTDPVKSRLLVIEKDFLGVA